MKQTDIPVCISLIEQSFVRHEIRAEAQFESQDIATPPWSWFNDKNVFFFVREYEGQISAFSVVRRVGQVAHLHSIVVAANFQKRGLGTKMLNEHETFLNQADYVIKLHTLHTYADAVQNHRFYLNRGYQKYQSGDEITYHGLNEWIENCKVNGDWPLTDNKVLFFKTASKGA